MHTHTHIHTYTHTYTHTDTPPLTVCRRVAQVSYLEVEVETLTEQLHSPEVCEQDQNGSVAPEDLDHIQKVNRELEQQLADKNRVRWRRLPRPYDSDEPH